MDANAGSHTPEDPGHPVPGPSDQAVPEVMTELVPWPSAVGSGPAAPDGYYRPPNPGIVHLLAWLAIAAGLIAIIEFEYAAMIAELQRRGLGDMQVRLPLPWIAPYVRPILSAAGLVGVWVLLRDKLRGAAGRLQPGHWLLVVLSASYLFGLTLSAVHLAFPRQLLSFLQSGTFFTVWSLGSIAVHLALAVVFLLLAVGLRETLRWRLVMVAMTIHVATWLQMFVSMGVHFHFRSLVPLTLMQELPRLSSLAAFIVLLVAAGMDLVNRCRRDWLHWLGVLMLGWMLAYSLLCWIPSIARRWA